MEHFKVTPRGPKEKRRNQISVYLSDPEDMEKFVVLAMTNGLTLAQLGQQMIKHCLEEDK